MEGRPTADGRAVHEDTEALGAYVPAPWFGILPANACINRAAQPALVDPGVIVLREAFMPALRSAIDGADIRWLWPTHIGPDHIGSPTQVLDEAPNARLITTHLGMGTMGLHGFPLDRVNLLSPGQSLNSGDRELVAVKPPSFDAPESTGFVDSKTRAFSCVDCFGTLVNAPAATLVDGETVPTPWEGRSADYVEGDGMRVPPWGGGRVAPRGSAPALLARAHREVRHGYAR